MPCISQCIQTDDLILRMLFHHIINKVAANKSGAAGNNDLHKLSPLSKIDSL